jgi:DNA-binding NtrC family response regulator
VRQTLKTILKSSQRPVVELIEESAGVDETLYFSSTRGTDPLLWRQDDENNLSTLVSNTQPDLVFLLLSPTLLRNADQLLRSFRGKLSNVPCVVIVEAGEPDQMFELLTLGVSDFISPPLTTSKVLPRVWRLIGKGNQEENLDFTLKEQLGLSKLVGKSPAFLSVVKKIPMVARCDANVLITGETGTGKELVAQAIHYLSPRASKPFVPVNCGAIPTDLVENELFGHQPGAYTGAMAKQFGLINEAEGGTLFLDEVDCLPLLVQTKLLRFLQDREYRVLGSAKVVKADVRVLAASNSDLGQAVEEGTFRGDLYYRLSVIPLALPPLRERIEDIPRLASHFLEKFVHGNFNPTTHFTPDAIRKLLLHPWPGNIRELENVVEQATVLSGRNILRGDDLSLSARNGPTDLNSFREAKAIVVDKFERDYINKLLLAYGGNISQAAQAAQKNRRAFWELIRKHGIKVNHFKPASQ